MGYLGDAVVEKAGNLEDGFRGTYDFLSNKIRLGDDDPMVEFHERVHAGNIEALVEDPEMVREKAVKAQELPSSYTEGLDRLGVAKADYSLASGITFQSFKEKYGFDISSSNSFVKKLFSSKFNSLLEDNVERYGLDGFDVRDEALTQTVESYEKGFLEDDYLFQDKIETIEEAYNDLKGYREDAGSLIKEEMIKLRDTYGLGEGSEESLSEFMNVRNEYLRGSL